MQVLIVSATLLEIKKLIDDLKFDKKNEQFYYKQLANSTIDVLIGDIGIAFTIYSLSKALSKKNYDLVINTGIAGSLTEKLKIGDVAQVASEEFADLGIRSEREFSTLFEMGFMDKNEFPFTEGKLINPDVENNLFHHLKSVKGITVNAVNGNKKEIEKLKEKFDADIECMEGAAVFYICLMEKIPFAEIRAISNYVEERNKDKWDIPLAIGNLTEEIKYVLKNIETFLKA